MQLFHAKMRKIGREHKFNASTCARTSNARLFLKFKRQSNESGARQAAAYDVPMCGQRLQNVARKLVRVAVSQRDTTNALHTHMRQQQSTA